MSKKIALVTNVLEYVGPPAVEVLIREGFVVIAHDDSFNSEKACNDYQRQNNGVITTALNDPSELINFVFEHYPTLDVIISNDAYPAIHTTIEDADIKQLSSTIEHLLFQPFQLMQAVIPRLRAQGYGNVIMITSSRTELPLRGGAIPDVARAGANALVKSLSIELAPYNIAVNAIAPNYLYSEAYFPKDKFIDDPSGREFIKQVVPAGRLGEPEEIGELVSYLANMKGAFHTGSIIKFAGGWPNAPARPD